jgi:hypothetical protein
LRWKPVGNPKKLYRNGNATEWPFQNDCPEITILIAHWLNTKPSISKLQHGQSKNFPGHRYHHHSREEFAGGERLVCK